MIRFVDVALADNVRLPYVPGAECALAGFDAALAAAWELVAAAFPGITLNPLFDAMPVDEIQAMAAAARERSGEEPPDLLAWFAIPVADEVAVAGAVAALPFVAMASPRPQVLPCAVPMWGSSTEGRDEIQVVPPPRGVNAVRAWHVPGGTAPGVRICDIEDGWDLTHEDLRRSPISPVSLLSSPSQEDIDHGTSVAGILVGADDGVGIVGIAPGAQLLLVSDDLGGGSNTAAAKIALSRGWPRIVPPAIVTIGGDSLSAAFLDTENRLVRRQWQFFGGWSDLDPIPAAKFPDGVLTGRPVLTVRQEQAPIARLVTDAFMVGLPGIEHIWWDDQGELGSLQSVADLDHIALGTVTAVAVTSGTQVAVASVTPDGRLLAMVGDAGQHFPGGLSTGVPLDPGNSYRRLRNPAIRSRIDGAADVVAIDDNGTLRWFTGVTDATIGTGWQPGVADTSGVAFDGGAGVTALVVGSDDARTLVALAVGRDGHLRAIDIDPAQGAITSVFLVGAADVAAEAPVALGLASDSVVALAVNTAGTLLAATRAAAGGSWSDQVQVNPDTTVMPSGGVVAASLDVGVFALLVDIKGTVITTQSRNGVDWQSYEDVSE